MSRFARVALCAAALLALSASSAVAHDTSPKYQSFYNGVKPNVSGVQAQVLGFDNQYEIVNPAHKTIVIYGYNGEPYARILPDGTVEVNTRSPAYYLNQDRFGAVKVPASANGNAVPQWKVQDQSNRFVWHDHRMHWMAHTLPPRSRTSTNAPRSSSTRSRCGSTASRPTSPGPWCGWARPRASRSER